MDEYFRMAIAGMAADDSVQGHGEPLGQGHALIYLGLAGFRIKISPPAKSHAQGVDTEDAGLAGGIIWKVVLLIQINFADIVHASCVANGNSGGPDEKGIELGNITLLDKDGGIREIFINRTVETVDKAIG